MNYYGIWAIYNLEMTRAIRTIGQTLAAPILSTILYFIVFGSAIGQRIGEVEGIEYGTFIVPGLVMLTVLSQSVSNASFGIYVPRFNGTIYEILSSPLSTTEIVIGYVGAAATKSIILGLTVLLSAGFFVPLYIKHPIWMMFFLIVTSINFSLLGFIIGIFAKGFDKLQMIPLLVINPLTFLGGSFYSIKMLPEIWQTISLFNPIVYLISCFKWSFYENTYINPLLSAVVTGLFSIICILIIALIFRTGYRLKE